MQITRKSVPTEVLGPLPELNTAAPEFSVLDLNDTVRHLSDYQGKPVLISVFPDIDTRTCDLQTKRFYSLAKEHKDLTILNISNNSKEQLQNWCIANGADIIALRDNEGSFAKAYGLWMPEYKVLARSVFVINADGTLIYEELVSEMADEPNYQAALDALA